MLDIISVTGKTSNLFHPLECRDTRVFCYLALQVLTCHDRTCKDTHPAPTPPATNRTGAACVTPSRLPITRGFGVVPHPSPRSPSPPRAPPAPPAKGLRRRLPGAAGPLPLQPPPGSVRRRAAGAGTVCPARRGGDRTPAVTHSETPSSARRTEPPPHLRRVLAPLRRRAPSEKAAVTPVQAAGHPEEAAPAPHSLGCMKPGPPAPRQAPEARSQELPPPPRTALSPPGARCPTDLERCFRICFLIIPAMTSAGPRPSRQPAGTGDAPHPSASPCPRRGDRRERSRCLRLRSLGGRRHLSCSIA